MQFYNLSQSYFRKYDLNLIKNYYITLYTI